MGGGGGEQTAKQLQMPLAHAEDRVTQTQGDPREPRFFRYLLRMFQSRYADAVARGSSCIKSEAVTGIWIGFKDG